MAFSPNPAASELVAGSGVWAPHELTNGIHPVRYIRLLEQRRPRLEEMAYL